MTRPTHATVGSTWSAGIASDPIRVALHGLVAERGRVVMALVVRPAVCREVVGRAQDRVVRVADVASEPVAIPCRRLEPHPRPGGCGRSPCAVCGCPLLPGQLRSRVPTIA